MFYVFADVAAAEFRFSAVEFLEKLLFDEADKKVSITRSHFSAHSDSVNLLVIVVRERKAVKPERVQRISVTVLGCLLARWSKKYLSARSPSCRRLGDSFREHLRDVEINDKDASTPVARHFNLPNLSQKHMAVCGLSLHLGKY